MKRNKMKRKTTAPTDKGDFHITPLGLLDTDGYQLTHHVLPNQVVHGIDELLAIVGFDEFNNGNINIRLIAANDGATIVFGQDNRHGVDGWRASRYVNGQWDEWDLFFPTLHEGILTACLKGEEAETAIDEARNRF